MWRNQSDWTAYFVVFPVSGVRSGAQLLLAWVIAITGMSGLMVYMALLVALNVTLIGVATALISAPHRHARLLAAILLSSSAMLTLGVVLQLIAQVLGLILLALGCVLCLAPFYRLGKQVLFRFIVLASVVMATFVLAYPEMLGFFGIAFLIHHGLAVAGIRRFGAAAFKAVVAIAIIAGVLIAPEAPGLAAFMLHQARVGGTAMRLPELFPYFLVPSGLAAQWGLSPYVVVGEGLWLTAAIICGTVLSGWAVVTTCWLSWRGEPAAAVGAVMIPLAPLLFLTDNGFGTEKLAMYAQPFLLPTIVLAACRAARIETSTALVRTMAMAAVCALIIANGAVQYRYLSRSARTNQQHAIMLDRLARLQGTASDGPVMLDVPEFGKDSMVALHARGRPAIGYAGEGYVGPLANTDLDVLSRRNIEVANAASELLNAYHPHQFDLAPASGLRHEFIRFELAEPAGAGPRALVTPAGDQSILNNSAERPATGRYYVQALGEVRNHLVLISSTLGHRILPGVVDKVALWQREPDFANGRTGMQGMGRHLLFEVLNPVPGSRMLVDVSALGGADVDLSYAVVFGKEQRELGLIGRGAARMRSDPIAPRTIDGRHYIALDMGAEPQRITYERHGISALYNRNLSFDRRRMVGFARNISLLTDEQAKAMIPPMGIEHFPADLFAPGLLFSGLYEDGWMAEAAKFRLGSDHRTNSVRIKARTPGVNPKWSGAMLEVLVDGHSVALRRLRPGDLDEEIPIPPAAGPRWIELRVDTTARLSAADHRVASILLKSIALESRE